MKKNYETRHIFMAIAIGILLLAPVFILLMPLFVANTLYYTPRNWYVFVSGTSYFVYSIGFMFLFLSAMILFLLASRKSSIYISIACLLLGGVSFYVASQNYIAIGDASISYRETFSKVNHSYPWSEIERVIYNRVPRSEGFSEYEFYFNDGNNMILPENGIVKGLRDSIYNRLSYENIKVE